MTASWLPAALLAGVAAFGAWTLRRRAAPSAHYLAGRRLPWWLAAFALASAELSALSLIGVPAVAYRENWQYLQFFLGAAAARVCVAFWLYPLLRETGAPTIYGWFGRRFGRWTQTAGALLFIPTRLCAASVRLMVAGAAASLLLDWRLLPTLAAAAAAAATVAAAGLRAVVIAQAALFVVLAGAVAAAVWAVFGLLEGGVGDIFHTVEAAGRLGLWAPGAAWSALVYGFFASIAVFGADQEMMQAALGARSRRSGQRAMIWAVPLNLAALVGFLLLGAFLFVFYEQHPELALPADLDAIVTHFARQNFSPALRGLLATAVLAASIDLPAFSLAAAAVHDVYRPWLKPRASERHLIAAGRAAAVGFALACFFGAAVFVRRGDWMWLAFKAGGAAFGPLLSLVVVGRATQWRLDRGAAAAAAVAAGLCLWLLTLIERQVLPFDWGWLVPLGGALHAALCRGLLFLKRP